MGYSRYASCEEEAHLSESCCISCFDYNPCYRKEGSETRYADTADGDDLNEM
jgi:hypothetical protein